MRCSTGAITITDLIEVLHTFLSEGLTWSSAVAIILAIMKIKDSAHKKRVEVQKANDIRAIKEALCIKDGPPVTVNTGPTNLKRLSTVCSAGLSRVNQSRRKSEMNQINYVTLIVALLGTAKLVLQAFGIDVITDDMIDKAANVVAAVVTLVGVIITHRKKGVDNLDASIQSSIEPAE
jgi:uncharacterized membrane protein